jgi:predicted nuclease of restriction endonuclease-like (RecB) superfamily
MKRRAEKVYTEFLSEVKERIRKAQCGVLAVRSKRLINFYWNLGRMICEKQEELKWGSLAMKKLALDLQMEFPAAQGLSAGNIRQIREFYLNYHHKSGLAPAVREISWTRLQAEL